MAYVIGIQAVCAALVVLIAGLFGLDAALSAALGAVVALLPNMLFALYLKVNARPSVVRLMLGESIKLLLVFALSYFVWRRIEFVVHPLPYWVSLVVVIKAHSFGLLRAVT
ncbi:ATP synthase subunit I [Hydromonas duriensis]|uniref:ATP synthase I subunit n=1 Tax=Hydromonas duriensis TaxID=1527608 RepID=A0A4R6Y3Q0_9BURK|nr:ATP synthase subunit I [Hydromonas duriensis]TDR30990.1 ATP synthase I subunit [Hydromonas duriensis]